MPGMNGAEFCRQVRAQPAHRDLPIVMLSAGPEPVCVLRCWTLFFFASPHLSSVSRQPSGLRLPGAVSRRRFATYGGLKVGAGAHFIDAG
ncbi:hypothetical protein [Paraburkholderia largidicola]|uniref:hypothetical protein n=1 Tax=Paraburkholderia largidicola TaxID=3014751 RepID=UPI001FB10178|nr:hypothetical protein [Paraburkholderia sp. PGU16]